MVHLRLIEIIEHLLPTAQKKLLLFLQSPYHNRGYNSEKIIDLYRLIVDALAKNELLILEKRELQQYFYPEFPYEVKKKNAIDALASDLFSRVKDFLFFEHIQEETFQMQETIALAKFYRLHELPDRFSSVIKKGRKWYQQRGEKDADYYLDGFFLESEVAAFQSTFNSYTEDANINNAEDYLDRFYATQKLENYTLLTFQKGLSKSTTEDKATIYSVLLDTYRQYDRFHTPLADLYFTISQWLKNPPDMEALDRFVEQLKSKQAEIAPLKYRNLMALYRYFLTLKYRSSAPRDPNVTHQLFAVYQAHLAAGYLDVNGQLLPTTLKSMINLAVRNNEIEWAKQTLRQFPPELITGTRFPQEAHDLCQAEVAFANGEYLAAENKLTYCKFENVNYSIIADVLLVKIYYATEQSELLDNRLQALEKKIRRSNISDQNQVAYLNFVKLLNRIIRYQFDLHSTGWKKIMRDLPQTTDLLEREWLSALVQKTA